MPEISVFVKRILYHRMKRLYVQVKKCLSPARLVFIAIRGVRIVTFANRLFVLPSTRSIVEIRGSRSQIDLPSAVSSERWLKL